MAFVPSTLVSQFSRPEIASKSAWFTPVQTQNLIVSHRAAHIVRMETKIQVAGAGMRVIRQADEATIEKLGCRSWDTWGCEPSTFPWTYSSDEVCLILAGDLTVIPDDGSEPMGKLIF